MDAYTRKYIHEHLGYRFSLCGDSKEAMEMERQIRRGDWLLGKPMLNPQK